MQTDDLIVWGVAGTALVILALVLFNQRQAAYEASTCIPARIVTIGQCAYSKWGSVGDSDCVALDDRGVSHHSKHPWVVGEQACR